MSLVSSALPNLLNGISQQSPSLRLSSQAEMTINGYASPVEGLGKRPPSVHAFTVPPGITATQKILSHLINRDNTEHYKVLITSTGVMVLDLINYTSIPVAYEASALAYLSCSKPQVDLRAMTVGDNTFILNRTKAVKASLDVIERNTPQALLWVRQGAFGSRFSVTLNGIEVAYKTPEEAKGSKTSYDDGTNAIVGYMAMPPRFRPEALTASFAASDSIASNLIALLQGHPTLSTRFVFALSGSNILITPKLLNGAYADFSLTVTDSQGDTILRAYKGKIQNFTDLPQRCFPNFRIKVMGSEATSFDDYYVRYEGTTSGGTWVEDIAPDEKYKLDPATMPHTLVRTASGSFTLRAVAWVDRKTGDEEANPLPSFVGQRIRDLFFFRNRLGFISREHVSMSAYGDYFTFFNASSTVHLDTDPIDVAVSHVRASDLNHAVATNETLLLFARETQFQIATTPMLTPTTVGFNQVTEYGCSVDVKPVGLGQFTMFTTRRGAYSSVMEYFTAVDSNSNVAADITDAVPMFIPGDISFLSGSTSENVLIALSETKKNEIYVYKFLWSGEEKIQSGWTKWVMDAGCDIVAAEFLESVLWLTILRNGKLVVEWMDLSPGVRVADLPFNVHLDRRVDEGLVTSISYDEVKDRTTIVLPYSVPSNLQLYAANGNPSTDVPRLGKGLFTGYVEGERVEFALDQDGRTLTVPFNLQNFWAGVPYTFTHVFSQFFIRTRGTDGTMQTVDTGRFQLRRLSLRYVATGYFKIAVDLSGRSVDSGIIFNPKRLGIVGTILNRLRVATGVANIPIASEASRATVTITNDSILPSSFISGTVEGVHISRTRTL